MGFNAFRSVCYVDGNTGSKSYIDMQLMSQCKGVIASNSAFSYLAALLNTRKISYIGPQRTEMCNLFKKGVVAKTAPFASI